MNTFKIEMTVFKESGKYYTDTDIEVPRDGVKLIEMGDEYLVYTPDLINWIKSRPEVWPVRSLNEFMVHLDKKDESDGICIVPHIFRG